MSDVLRCELASLGADVIVAIAREVPAYARPLEGRFGHGVQVGVHEALSRFLSVVDSGASDVSRLTGPPDLADSRDVYVQLGRG
nr:hypothetical protein [Micromonospora sp. DSM 115978]